MASKPILITGAGLSSLLLAKALKSGNIPFLIYERDESFYFRGQGYRLRLSSEGLDAIQSVLNEADWVKFWDACGKTGGPTLQELDAFTGQNLDPGYIVNRSDSTKTIAPPASREGITIGIARGTMRSLFADELAECIRWGHQVTGYELSPDGVFAVFADGTKGVEGSMLVAGDGGNSHVALQLSDGNLKVYDTGSRGVQGQAPTSAFTGLGEGVFRMVANTDKGKCFAITNVRGSEMNDPDVKFGWTMGAQPGVINAPNNDYSVVGKVAADIAKELTRGWHPRFKAIFDEMDEDEAAFWKITCSSPNGVPQWKNEPRVTVIGDAAHGMTPAGGLGANTAVRDSALLGRLLRDAGGYKAGITKTYEDEMRVYASEAVKASYKMARMAFGINELP